MLIIKSKKSGLPYWTKVGFVAFFVTEAVLFAGSYYFWHKLNTRRDFRNYLRENYPYFLETYYKTGEFLSGDNKIRQSDYTYWGLTKVGTDN